MFKTTLDLLKCPAKRPQCGGALNLEAKKTLTHPKTGAEDIISGSLVCQRCHAKYPIIGGVAILVPKVRDYLLFHVKGIAQRVEDDGIPAEFRSAYLKAKRVAESEYIEWDLESERVNSLYVLNHYVAAEAGFWRSTDGFHSAVIGRLIEQNWDQGPLAKVQSFFMQRQTPPGSLSLVELGCGVGGLAVRLKGVVGRYLGVDSSFASVILARHLVLGAPMRGEVLIPEDLLAGPVSRRIPLPAPPVLGTQADFVVGDLASLPLQFGAWDASASLNVIDMMDRPELLPETQRKLLREGGLAIQSCPYIWHPEVAEGLRKRLPRNLRGSAQAIEHIYKLNKFKITESHLDIPWLFFKHVRQLEIYSVHLFFAQLDRAI